jgi:5-(carboxyamino)imidazole ribonucleotide synthase
MKAIPPGSVLGILGGGQLGRMLAMAAAQLGYRCHIYCPEKDCPAAQVAAAHTAAGYDDMAALDRFAAQVAVATIEFENIPLATLERVAAGVPARPGAAALRISQDRLLEKDFVRQCGGRTADYRAVDSLGDLQAALGEIPPPVLLKTRRMGYDGKGQVRITSVAEAPQAWAAIQGAPAIIESLVPFALEISVIVARGLDGAMEAFVPVENRHSNGILATTIAPAAVAPATAAAADRLARTLTERLGVVGLLAVEMFVDAKGGVLVNEMAPRVHNSGHWTMEACATSQFEQQVRAVCGLPLGSPKHHSNAVMRNLIGDEVDAWPKIAADPAAKLHLYGKAEARPGRKMGHVTRLYPLGAPPPA